MLNYCFSSPTDEFISTTLPSDTYEFNKNYSSFPSTTARMNTTTLKLSTTKSTFSTLHGNNSVNSSVVSVNTVPSVSKSPAVIDKNVTLIPNLTTDDPNSSSSSIDTITMIPILFPTTATTTEPSTTARSTITIQNVTTKSNTTPLPSTTEYVIVTPSEEEGDAVEITNGTEGKKIKTLLKHSL